MSGRRGIRPALSLPTRRIRTASGWASISTRFQLPRPMIVGGETGGRWLGGIDRQLRAQLLSPFVSQKLGTFVASENAKDLMTLRELIEAGKLVPAIDRTYPLREVAPAIRHMLEGHARGKIVITV